MKYTLREWQQIEKPVSELIVQASTIEEEAADGWQPFPIGMSYQYLSCYTSGSVLQLGTHDKLAHCAINIETDQARRRTMNNRKLFLHNLSKHGIYNQQLDGRSYFLTLPHYKFIISPEGNGIDCHRHYEALLAGCIPVIEKNPLIEEKYKHLPILWTTDYSEITNDYLISKYNEMIDTTYDFSKLFLSSYTIPEQTEIKRCGNYWCKKIRGIHWYQTKEY